MHRLYRSWRVVALGTLLLSLVVGISLSSLSHHRAKADPSLSYESTWIGNSGGDPNTYIQMSTATIGVQPNTGYSFGAIDWDEGGREVGMYDPNGNAIGGAQALQGGTGIAVTANSSYIFFSVRDGNANQIRRNETGATGNWGIEDMEIKVSDQSSIQDGGAFWRLEQGWPMSGHDINVGRLSAGITGIAATDSTVYASDYPNNRVVLLDNSLNQQTSYSVARPAAIAVAPDGTLWVVSGADDNNSPVIVQLDSNGNATGKQITGLQDPRGLAFLSNGTLLVAENGDRQQVVYYNVSGTPTIVDTLGQQGGIYTGSIPGQITSDRFHDLVGVATDSSDNIYLACNGGGAEFRKFSSSKQLLWAKYGLEFVDRGDFDASTDGQDVYTKQEHIHLDYSQNTPGSEWSYQAYTVNPHKYPDDPRLHVSPDATWVRTINGQKFLFLSEMYSGFLAVYRFDSADGEIAVPAGFFGHSPQWQNNTWPSVPTSNDWIWTDSNGDGALQSGEIQNNATSYSYNWGWWPDSQGNIWETLNDGVLEIPFQGLNSVGAPIYSFSNAVKTDMPAPFNSMHRLEYHPESDTMYIGGYTPDQPYDSTYWGEMGKVVARYDNWSKGNRTATYTFLAPWNTNNNPATVNEGLSVAGNYIFITEGFHPTVHVYDKNTGNEVGTMFYPSNQSWVDIPFGIIAFQRSNGEYEVLQEDDGNAKDIWFRMNDGGGPPPPTPTPIITPTHTPTPTATPTATPTSTPTSGNLVLAINAGGNSSGNFVADTDVDQGNPYSDTSSSIDTGGVSNPAPQDVYQSCRWNSAFTYTIPNLTAGASYQVRLHFAELTFQQAGQRTFNVAINGSSVLSNFDVYATAGYKHALVEKFTATADSNGNIAIAFTQGGADNPFVNGIEVYTA